MATAAPTESGWRHRPVAVHTHTEVLGLSLLAGAIALLLTAGLASGIPASDAVFLVPMIAAPVIGAVLAWRFTTWGHVVGLLLGLAVAVMTFWLGFGLLQPASFIEFTAGTAWVLGVSTMVWGGIGSVVRRQDVRADTPRSEQLLDRTVLGIVVLAFAVSLPLWLGTRTTVEASAAAGLQEVAAANFSYADLTASAGESIVVRNDDPFHHTFTVDALGIDVDLLPGSATIVQLPSTTGIFTFYCVPHSTDAGEGEDSMAATLTIE